MLLQTNSTNRTLLRVGAATLQVPRSEVDARAAKAVAGVASPESVRRSHNPQSRRRFSHALCRCVLAVARVILFDRWQSLSRARVAGRK